MGRPLDHRLLSHRSHDEMHNSARYCGNRGRRVYFTTEPGTRVPDHSSIRLFSRRSHVEMNNSTRVSEIEEEEFIYKAKDLGRDKPFYLKMGQVIVSEHVISLHIILMACSWPLGSNCPYSWHWGLQYTDHTACLFNSLR